MECLVSARLFHPGGLKDVASIDVFLDGNEFGGVSF